MGREEITAVNQYTLFGVEHGGVKAIKGLYRSLSRYFDINVVTLCSREEINIYYDETFLTDQFRLITLSDSCDKYTYRNRSKSQAESVVDTIKHYRDNEPAVSSLSQIAANSKIIISEHPYSYNFIKKACPDKKVWYRAQNVEYDYMSHECKNVDESILNEIYEIENECCVGADCILTLTNEDSTRLQELYSISANKIVTISAGCETSGSEFVLPSNRKKANEKNEMTVFYISSGMQPSVTAAKYIISAAIKLSNMMFIVAGNVGNVLLETYKEPVPENVLITGYISDNEKKSFLMNADVALNIVEGGSGINIKMFEYFAYGIPVISSEFGARGISVKDGSEIILTTTDNLAHTLRHFMEKPIEYRDTLAINARKLLENEYSWNAVSDRVVKQMKIAGVCPDDYSTSNSSDKAANSEKIYNTSSILPERAKVYIWGTGRYGDLCLSSLREELKVDVLGFIDSDIDKQGKKKNGYPVLSPDDYFKLENNSIVCIAISRFAQVLEVLALNNVPIERIYVMAGNNGYCIDRDKLKNLYMSMQNNDFRY